MHPTPLSTAERLKSTLVVLAWLALALVMREAWTSGRTPPAGEPGFSIRVDPDPPSMTASHTNGHH